MKKINTMIIAVVAASLILVAGCYDGGVTQPPVLGYDGFVAAGWAAFEAGDYDTAMDNFQWALEADVTRPDAYLGAGWSSILLPGYWGTGDQYDYMALQLDGGTWPVEFNTVTVEQNLDWSEFVCIDPVLTANDIMVINAWGDSLLVVEGDTLVPHIGGGDTTLVVENAVIGDWLYGQYSNIRFQYTFEIADPNVKALFSVANGFSLIDSSVDSIINGASASTVYLSVPYVRVKVGDAYYRTWCMYENAMTFEYATYDAPTEPLAFGTDAIAAYGILQNAKGVNGSEHLGVATLLGLAAEGEYTFSHYAGITTLKLKGMAAAMAYSNLHFRPALGICREAGYALDVEVSDPNFLVELMQAIEMMLI